MSRLFAALFIISKNISDKYSAFHNKASAYALKFRRQLLKKDWEISWPASWVILHNQYTANIHTENTDLQLTFSNIIK